MDNLRGLLGIRRMDRVQNARIREFYGMTKGVDEKIDEGVLRWFGHVERMEKERIAKRVYVGQCAGSRSVGRPRKRWIETVKDCLIKKVFVLRQAKRMVQDTSEGQFRWKCLRGLHEINIGVMVEPRDSM